MPGSDYDVLSNLQAKLRHPLFPGVVIQWVVIQGLLQLSACLPFFLSDGLEKHAFDVLIHAAIWPIALEICDLKAKGWNNDIVLRFLSLLFLASLTFGTVWSIKMLAADLASFV